MKISASSILSPNNIGGSSRNLQLFNLTVKRGANSDSSATSENVSQRITAGASLQASQATSAARIAQNATSKIVSLRELQETYVEEADISNDPERRSELQTAIDELDTEIVRIKSEALDEVGDNVLEGKTYDITDTDFVALANLSSIASSSGVDVSTEAGADSAISTFDELISNAINANEAATLAVNKAESVLSEITAVETESREQSDAVKSAEEAERLAEQVANELRAKASEAEFADLNADSVLLLLS